MKRYDMLQDVVYKNGKLVTFKIIASKDNIKEIHLEH